MHGYPRTWHFSGQPLCRLEWFSVIPEQGPGELLQWSSVNALLCYLRQILGFLGISSFKPGQPLDGARAFFQKSYLSSYLKGPGFCSLTWLSQRVTFCQSEFVNLSLWQYVVLFLEDKNQIFLNYFSPYLLKCWPPVLLCFLNLILGQSSDFIHWFIRANACDEMHCKASRACYEVLGLDHVVQSSC